MKKYLLPVLTAALCLSATSAFAQKKGLVKGLIDGLSSKTPVTLGSQVERKVTSRLAAQTAGQYHPVFGYTYPSALTQLEYGGPHTVFTNDIVSNASLMQVAPILDEHKVKTAFFPYHFLDGAQVTEMIYLWRLANPQGNLKKSPSLFYRLAQEKAQEEQAHIPVNKWENLPNLLLLKRLMQQANNARSYAELYENITVYPQHITLNNYGFPVETKYADYAKELDLYLMLSNPKEMRAYNNAGKYTPFVLTKEEHEAANKLLALRQASEKLPENPTPRDLLDIAYNRLETHTIPYTEVKLDATGRRWSVDADYKAYPNYKNTQLYRTIKGMIANEDPYSYPHGQDLSKHQLDMLHLMVLDAVMGGVETDNLEDVNKVLIAFDKLRTSVPQDQQDHVSILRKNLQVVFDDLVHFNRDNKIDWTDPRDARFFKAVVAKNAQFLLNNIHIYQ